MVWLTLHARNRTRQPIHLVHLPVPAMVCGRVALVSSYTRMLSSTILMGRRSLPDGRRHAAPLKSPAPMSTCSCNIYSTDLPIPRFFTVLLALFHLSRSHFHLIEKLSSITSGSHPVPSVNAPQFASAFSLLCTQCVRKHRWQWQSPSSVSSQASSHVVQTCCVQSQHWIPFSSPDVTPRLCQ